MVQLTLRIKDWSYTKDVALPDGEVQKCPAITNPLCPDGVLVPQPEDPVTKCPRPSWCKPNPPTSEFKIVKILPEGTLSFPNANEGETVKISATVICKKKDIVSKPRDTAYLVIDGAVIENKQITDGSVVFEWQATSTPINIHTICVKVQPSDSCKGIGQDCKKITVSPIILDPSEQLLRERESAREQRQLLEESRRKLREEIISGEIQIPTPIQIPPVTPPTPTPTPPTPTVPDTGAIEIVGLPIEITPAIPVYLYIDGSVKGRIYSIPKTFDNIPVGTHTTYITAKDLQTPPKTVIISKDQITSVIL